jgi:hypothetical protein
VRLDCSCSSEWIEKIMSKINDSSDFGRATLEDHGTLADSELDAVSGGTYTKQKPDGSAAGNVAAKWSVAQGAVA